MQLCRVFRVAPLTLALMVALAILCFLQVANASYKKPPFNGSIFGKRANGATDYDSARGTLAALCEIANESCSNWFPESLK